MTEEKENVSEELKSIREEMKELKDMLKKKAASEEFEEDGINIGGRSAGRDHDKGPHFRIHIDDDDLNFEGVDETLSEYLGSVMEGVAQNLSKSMQQMASGFTFEKNMIKEEVERAKREVERNKRDIEREARRVKRQVERATRGFSGSKDRSIRFHKLSKEELEHFYEKAPDLTSALSDEKKLRLLKTLEDGPMYQKDLSEQTDIKGGTFKHHMDQLLEVQYVSQEAVRGRYLITQLGVEALKLAEMLFRRYTFMTEKGARDRDEDTEITVEHEQEIDEDIANTADTVNEFQNEEETG